MMAYLTRPRLKDGTPPPKKPYNIESFKMKSDLYLQGFLGTQDKDYYRGKLQSEIDKAVDLGVVSEEDAYSFIRERNNLYKDLQDKATDQPAVLPKTYGREEFSDGTPPIKEILRNMAQDRMYEPPINLAAKGRGLPAGFKKAKEELRKEIPNFDELYNRNITYRKKQKLKQKMVDDPEYKQTEMAKKAERRRRRRAGKLKDKTSLTPDEKFLNYQQSLITRQLNDKIKENPDLVLKNKKLMDQISTTVSKEGDIIKVKPNLSQLKERGLFEIEHQRDIFKEGKLKDFPYNRNLILSPHNRAGGFKSAAEKFIEKNPNSPKVVAILDKANELKITLQPDVTKGTFATKGIGYKQTPDAVKKFVDVASDLTPNLVDEKIGVPQKDIGKIKQALGQFKKYGKFAKQIAKPAVRAISPFVPFAGALGVGLGAADVAKAASMGYTKPDEAAAAYLLGPEGAKGLASFKEKIVGQTDETEEFVP